jgi:hypothetical protein
MPLNSFKIQTIFEGIFNDRVPVFMNIIARCHRESVNWMDVTNFCEIIVAMLLCHWMDMTPSTVRSS